MYGFDFSAKLKDNVLKKVFLQHVTLVLIIKILLQSILFVVINKPLCYFSVTFGNFRYVFSIVNTMNKEPAICPCLVKCLPTLLYLFVSFYKNISFRIFL